MLSLGLCHLISIPRVVGSLLNSLSVLYCSDFVMQILLTLCIDLSMILCFAPNVIVSNGLEAHIPRSGSLC